MPTPRPPRSRTLATAVVACTLLAGSAACAPTPTEPAASRAGSGGPATGTPQDPGNPVDAALDALDRRQEVAQLFVAGVPLDDLGSVDALVAGGIGGVFLAGRSTVPVEELAATTGRWQAAAPGPGPWIAADQEGGRVQTLTGPGFDVLPPAVEQGGLPPEQLASLADGLGAALRRAGLNLNLAPVVDVVPAGSEAANEPIGSYDRQYGSTGAEVVPAATAIADGLAAHGVVPTFKHFPGLGRVTANTDTSSHVVDPVTAAGDEQVAAFADAVGRTSAEPFVMMSSAIYPQLDAGNQAAFSRAVVTDLLRGRLGFDGVVVSDDLANAAAVDGIPPGERAVRFLAAGGTLVLTVDAAPVPEMVDAVVERSEADPGFASAVDDAVRTALRAKADAGLLG